MSPHRFSRLDFGRAARLGALLVLVAVVAALFAIACDDDPGSADADSDSDSDGDSDSDTDTDADAGGEWACPGLVISICNDEGWPGPFIRWGGAADFGEGYTFVDVERRDAFLAERPDVDGGTEPVLVARSWNQSFEDVPGEYLLVTLGEEPPEPLHPVALVSSSGLYLTEWGFTPEGTVLAQGYPAVALLCGDSGCALYAVIEDSIDAAHLELIPNGEVPFVDARGMVPLTWKEFGPETTDPLCVFGDGIACFDGTDWTTVLEPGGPTLLAAATYWQDESTFLMASGASCRLVRQTLDGFEEIPLDCDVDLKTVHSEGELFAAGGDGILVLGFPEQTLECSLEGVDIAVLHEWAGINSDDVMYHWLTAFEQDGSVIEVRYYGYSRSICAFAEPLDGPLRAWSFLPFTDAVGAMVVTGSSAYWRPEVGGLLD